jgi:hypothetical protein
MLIINNRQLAIGNRQLGNEKWELRIEKHRTTNDEQRRTIKQSPNQKIAKSINMQVFAFKFFAKKYFGLLVKYFCGIGSIKSHFTIFTTKIF